MATVKQRLRVRLNRVRYSSRLLWASITGRKEFPFTFPAWRTGRPIPSLINFRTYIEEGFNRNELVYSCITLVASNAPVAPLKAWTFKDEDVVPVEHWLIDALQRPNPRQSRYEFFEMINIFLNLEGNAYVVKVPVGGEMELWLSRPDRMRPVFSGKELIGYVYFTDENRRTPFLPNDIVHVKMPNPGDTYEGMGRGLPPLGPAAMAVDVDNRATSFLKAFFDNAAVPFGLLKSKNILDDDEIKRIRERLKEQYAGDRAWHEMMILDADADYQKLGADISEIAWPQLRSVTEARICMAFKVPPIMVGAQVGLERSTYSNTEQAEKHLWRQKIVPDNERVASGFTTAFADDLPDGVFLKHDYSEIDALQESRNEKFTRASSGASGGWLTVNDARAEVGLPPVDGGDVFLRALMVQAVDALVAPEPVKGQKRLTLDLFEETGKRFHKVFDRIARAWEARFMSEAVEQFAEEKIKMLAILGSKLLGESSEHRKQDSTFDEFAKATAEYIEIHGKKNWKDAFFALFGGLMLEQAELWGETLGIDMWDFDNPEVQAFIADYAFQFADGLGNVTKEKLRLLVAQAQGEGWSINKLRDELMETYDGWGKVRAQMIAQTETIRSSNAGAVEAYARAGIEYKQWFTAEDARVCPWCAEMHGKIVGVRDNYFNRGEVLEVEADKSSMTFSYEDVGWPPLHPNCRCTILPVVEEV